MNVDVDLIAKIAGPVLTAAGAVIKFYLAGRAKLSWYLGHTSSFSGQTPQPFAINTHSVIVQNSGNKSAEDVRLSHQLLPVNIMIYPSIKHEIQRNADGSGDIYFPILVPKEQVVISYLYFPPLLWNQINSSVKSKDGFAKKWDLIPINPLSRATNIAALTLMFIGASFVFYFLIKLALTYAS